MTLPKSLLAAALVLLARQTLGGADDSIVVIAHSSISVSSIAPDDLREIFLGTRYSLSNGSTVTPVLLKAGPIHESFLRVYLGKTLEGFRAWWLQIVFTGQGLVPKSFASEADLIDYVSKTRGALGYAKRASVRGNVKCVPVTAEHKQPL